MKDEVIFALARELSSAAERADYLRQACGADERQRMRISALLEADDEEYSLLDRPFIPNVAVEIDTDIGKPGDVIGHYKLLQQIGEGGFGVVYMAEQREPLQRQVALKIIKPGMDSKQVIARFQAERQALALMDHPNIARVFDAGTTSVGRPYFVMELVKGIPITKYCDDQRLSPTERLALFIPVCRAIQHAHQKGIIHRDIKPSNLLISQYDGNPVPKVIDFGVAKAIHQRLTDRTMFTQFGQVIGTLEYMSPEQSEMNQLDVDTRSDIYALGAVLYELLTGTTPIGRERLRNVALEQMLRAIREEEPPSPSVRLSTHEELTVVSDQRKTNPASLPKVVRGELDWIVMKALEKQRERRYETANDLARDIERHLANEPVEAGPPSPAYRLSKIMRKYRRALSVVGAFAAVLCIATAISTWQAYRATTAATNSRIAEYRAKTERGKAQAAEGRAKMAASQRLADLVEARVTVGAQLIDEGNYADASLYFAEALRLDQGNPERERFHRLRCAFAIQACIKPAAIWNTGNSRARGFVVSKDEKKVVTFDHYSLYMGDSGEARIWELETGRHIATLKHGKNVHDAAFSPDGRYVVTGSGDHTARIWSATTGESVGPVLEHDLQVLRVSFSHDSDRLVTSTGVFSPVSEELNLAGRSAARVWSVPSGKLICELPHNDTVYDACFSPDDRLVATAGSDANVRIWNSETGRQSGPPLEHFHTRGQELPMISQVHFTADGTRLIASSNIGLPHRCWIWNLDERQLVSGAIEGALHDTNEAGTRFLTQSDDGHAQKGVNLWSIHGNKVAGSTISSSNCEIAKLSPNERQLVLVEESSRTANVFDTGSIKEIAGPLKHTSRVRAAEFIWEGRGLLTLDGNGQLRIWDLASREIPSRQISSDLALYPNSFSPRGDLVSLTSADGRFQIVDVQLDQVHGNTIQGNPRDASVFNSDGTLLLTYGLGSPQLWETNTGTRIATLRRDGATNAEQNTDLSVVHAAFSPRSNLVATASRNGIARVWDARTGIAVTSPLKHSSSVSHVAFSPDEKHVVVCTGVLFNGAVLPDTKGEARLWSIGNDHARSRSLAHDAPVTWADFSSDGKRLVTACKSSPDKCTAQVWDLERDEQIAVMQHGDSISQAMFSPDGSFVITLSDDGTAQTWDAATGARLSSPIVHQGKSTRRIVTRGNVLLTVADYPNAGQIWNLDTGQPLTNRMDYVGSPATLSANGEWLLYTENEAIHVLPLAVDDRPIDDIVATAEVLSGYQIRSNGSRIPLTAAEISRRFETLHRKSPAFWNCSPRQIIEWRTAGADWNFRAASSADDDGNALEKIRYLSQALALLPSQNSQAQRVLFDRGRSYALLARWEAALRDLNQANSIQASPAILYEIAQIHLRLNRLKEHQQICSQMARTFDLNTDADAVKWLARTGMLVPSSIDDWGQFAQILNQLHDVIFPRDLSWRLRAAAFLRAGRSADVLELYATRTDSPPEAVDFFIRAMAYAQSGKHDQAFEEFSLGKAWIKENLRQLSTTQNWKRMLEIEMFQAEAEMQLEMED